MDRTDLNVPYADRSIARAAGAKWDALNRVWYWPGSVVPDLLSAYAIPGARPDSAVLADLAERVDEIIQDLPAAYARKMAVGGLVATARADRLSAIPDADRVIPILKAAGEGPAIDAARAWLLDTLYGHHPSLPDAGVETLDNFLLLALPKALRPEEALSIARRLDSGTVILAGMRRLFATMIKEDRK